jgi:hypothetical protein
MEESWSLKRAASDRSQIGTDTIKSEAMKLIAEYLELSDPFAREGKVIFGYTPE